MESDMRNDNIAIEATGDWWGTGHKNNIYFDCVINERKARKQFSLPDFVKWHEYDGRAGGQEAGFQCEKCDSLLVGNIPRLLKLRSDLINWPR
jgi:hypothetical protein